MKRIIRIIKNKWKNFIEGLAKDSKEFDSSTEVDDVLKSLETNSNAREVSKIH